MKRAHFISGLFIVLFLTGAAFFAFSGARMAQASVSAIGADNLLNGRWALAYEEFFNKNLGIYEWSVEAWSILNYVLFREGKEGVLVGEDGWLFTKEEFDYFPDQNREVESKIDFIVSVRDSLAEKNIRMVVALVPAKARIYDQYLGRYRFPSYRQGLYTKALKKLEENGIAVADLNTPMKKASKVGDDRLFLRTDTHWTPHGAAFAARIIADEVRDAWPHVELDMAEFRTVAQEVMTYDGDLMRYIPLGELREEIGPPKDKLMDFTTEKSNENEVEASSLFADLLMPVTLVGTSYSANEKWNFAGFLSEALRAEVLNAADEGKGPFETMKKYLSDGSFTENPPKLVVWEIPERYLPVSYDLRLPL